MLKDKCEFLIGENRCADGDCLKKKVALCYKNCSDKDCIQRGSKYGRINL